MMGLSSHTLSPYNFSSLWICLFFVSLPCLPHSPHTPRNAGSINPQTKSVFFVLGSHASHNTQWVPSKCFLKE